MTTDTTKRIDEAIADIEQASQEDDVAAWLECAEYDKTILAALRFAKAMQPRPIEELDIADIDEDSELLVLDLWEEYRVVNIGWYDDENKPVWMDGEHVVLFTHFTPLPDQALKEFEEELK